MGISGEHLQRLLNETDLITLDRISNIYVEECIFRRPHHPYFT